MKIETNKNCENFNFNPELQPLFDAMNEGKTIKSVTCIGGEMHRNNPEKDFIVENFKADSYWVGISFNSRNNQYFDYVDTDKRSFYMNWVKSFEL